MGDNMRKFRRILTQTNKLNNHYRTYEYEISLIGLGETPRESTMMSLTSQHFNMSLKNSALDIWYPNWAVHFGEQVNCPTVSFTSGRIRVERSADHRQFVNISDHDGLMEVVMGCDIEYYGDEREYRPISLKNIRMVKCGNYRSPVSIECVFDDDGKMVRMNTERCFIV